jgi:hypothetical protein
VESRPLLRIAPLLLCACLASPPGITVDSAAGLVRAASQGEAQRISSHLCDLYPALLEHLPGARPPGDLEVWMQDEPHLYHSVLESNADAEGLYAPDHHRILLSRNVSDLERVLAHELGHSALDKSWAPLCGTLEEGLCDVLASQLVPSQAPRLRAGRLSSAALACGGLRLGLEVRDTRPRQGAKLGWSACILLTSEEEVPEDPLDMFRVRAGLSSTRVGTSVKRGYYGLAFLVAERIGLEELHALCTRAKAEGFSRIPRGWLLLAADLEEDTDSWRKAAAAGLGQTELRELLRMYPGSIAGALAHQLRTMPGTPAERWEALEGEVYLMEGTARLDVHNSPELRAEVLARL